LAKKVLIWIVWARRPLTTEELRHALAVEPACGISLEFYYDTNSVSILLNPIHALNRCILTM
jgi:hypothetical protein